MLLNLSDYFALRFTNDRFMHFFVKILDQFLKT